MSAADAQVVRLRYAARVSDEPREQSAQAPIEVSPVMRIVHLSMVATVLIYGGLMFMLTRPPSDPLFDASLVANRVVPGPIFTWVFAGVAACCVVAIAVLQRRIAGSSTFIFAIICWALCDAIAICGLILAMLHRSLEHFLPFAGVSLVVLLLLTPRRSWVRRQPAPELYQQ
jgi:hypothetical protein